ncbi:MAG: transcriptional regulator [Pantoea sp.]|uniref:transcriptional regulator n=1 Tax=Enterobacterales TaxID=91347 RepID=UPI001EB7DC5E|nr:MULTISPECIES: transcriptional regulator [Enterobacterales]EGT4441111.1 transcriptional regulator [Cronobacter sakazakii]MDU1574838.1 transcriptional regulator [Pantoea sp.]UNM56596.1 transcriptional regulator [Cronobacter sakazakii]
MHNDTIQSHTVDFKRTQAIIGNESAPTPNTPENISRDRLLRAQAGLLHLLTVVIPQITDEEQRHEMYLLVDGIHNLARFEECDAARERQAQEEEA